MDLSTIIQDLYGEKEKLERAIASLEAIQRTAESRPTISAPGKRRGRKSMGAEERLEVSERIKNYLSLQ